MKISHWFIVAGFIAPLFACSSSDDSPPPASGGAAGSGGTSPVVVGGSGGDETGGTGGGETGGTGGGETGGTGGGETGGTGGDPTGGTGGGTAIDECKTDTYGGGVCGDCMENKCADKCEACLTDATCVGYWNCTETNNCETQECYAMCEQQNPGGQKMMLDWLGSAGCVAHQCGTECDVDPICGPDWYNEPVCGQCFADNCSNECVACATNPNCMGFWQCIDDNACDTNECYDNCDAQNPGGWGPLYDWFLGCPSSHCTTECDMEPLGCALSMNVAACQTCMEQHCTSQCETYFETPGVFTHFFCFLDCTTEACLDACNAANPAAAAAFDLFDQCLGTNCETECAAAP